MENLRNRTDDNGIALKHIATVTLKLYKRQTNVMRLRVSLDEVSSTAEDW